MKTIADRYREEGREEGRERKGGKKREIVRQMVQKGMSLQSIQEITGFNYETIEKILQNG